MNKTSLIFTAFFIIVAGSFSAAAQSNNEKIIAEIMKLEAEHVEASKKQSADDFGRLTTEDYMFTARVPARIQTKADNQARLKDPAFKRAAIESLANSDVKVRVYNDDTALVTGYWKRVSRDAGGKDTSAAGRFTHVWIRQNGRWQLAGAHYSPDIDLEKLKTSRSGN